MVDVVSRRCDSPGCKRQPSGTTDATHVQFCSLHRGDGRAGYTLLMLAQRERLAAAAALEETQKQQQQQRERAPMSGSWPGKEISFSDYRPRWEAAASSGSSGGGSFAGGQPTPGSSSGTFVSNSSSSGSFLSSRRGSGGAGGSGGFASESFLSNRRTDEGAAGEAAATGHESKPTHNPHQWVWTAQPRPVSHRPPPLKDPSQAGVLGIAGRQQSPLDSTRGDSPGTEWTKPSSTQSAHAMYPAVKRHCSPRRRSFSHSPEPGSRSMVGLTGSMAGLQASSPASPNIMSLAASGGTPSPSGAMGLPTPPGSSGSATLPPPHNAPRRSAQRLPQPHFQNRAVPRGSGGPPRPPRSLSPGGVTTGARGTDGFYALSSSGRSPVSGVGFSPSGPPSASPGGGISGVFSPGSAVGSVLSGGGLNSARSSVSSTGPSPRWASPRNRAFGHTRTRSQGSVADTLEDLSIVDPSPPTLEPLRTFLPAATPLRSPRDRHRGGGGSGGGGFLERRNSEIILPLPDRTQQDPGPGPASDGRRRSFTASLFDQPGNDRLRAAGGNREDAMDIKDEIGGRLGGGSCGGSGGGGSNGAMMGNAGEDERWGMWGSGGEGAFQVGAAEARQQQGWPHQMQPGPPGDDHAGDGHVEMKESRRGSHHSVGTLPLTSSESMGGVESSSSGVFFSSEG